MLLNSQKSVISTAFRTKLSRVALTNLGMTTLPLDKELSNYSETDGSKSGSGKNVIDIKKFDERLGEVLASKGKDNYLAFIKEYERCLYNIDYNDLIGAMCEIPVVRNAIDTTAKRLANKNNWDVNEFFSFCLGFIKDDVKMYMLDELDNPAPFCCARIQNYATTKYFNFNVGRGFSMSALTGNADQKRPFYDLQYKEEKSTDKNPRHLEETPLPNLIHSIEAASSILFSHNRTEGSDKISYVYYDLVSWKINSYVEYVYDAICAAYTKKTKASTRWSTDDLNLDMSGEPLNGTKRAKYIKRMELLNRIQYRGAENCIADFNAYFIDELGYEEDSLGNHAVTNIALRNNKGVDKASLASVLTQILDGVLALKELERRCFAEGYSLFDLPVVAFRRVYEGASAITGTAKPEWFTQNITTVKDLVNDPNLDAIAKGISIPKPEGVVDTYATSDKGDVNLFTLYPFVAPHKDDDKDSTDEGNNDNLNFLYFSYRNNWSLLKLFRLMQETLYLLPPVPLMRNKHADTREDHTQHLPTELKRVHDTLKRKLVSLTGHSLINEDDATIFAFKLTQLCEEFPDIKGRLLLLADRVSIDPAERNSQIKTLMNSASLVSPMLKNTKMCDLDDLFKPFETIYNIIEAMDEKLVDSWGYEYKSLPALRGVLDMSYNIADMYYPTSDYYLADFKPVECIPFYREPFFTMYAILEIWHKLYIILEYIELQTDTYPFVTDEKKDRRKYNVLELYEIVTPIANLFDKVVNLGSGKNEDITKFHTNLDSLLTALHNALFYNKSEKTQSSLYDEYCSYMKDTSALSPDIRDLEYYAHCAVYYYEPKVSGQQVGVSDFMMHRDLDQTNASPEKVTKAACCLFYMLNNTRIKAVLNTRDAINDILPIYMKQAQASNARVLEQLDEASNELRFHAVSPEFKTKQCNSKGYIINNLGSLLVEDINGVPTYQHSSGAKVQVYETHYIILSNNEE